MACTCRFMLVSSSTTGFSAASASSAHLVKADFSVAQSARSFLKSFLSYSMTLNALINSSFAFEVSVCWDFRFSRRWAIWVSFVFSSACIQTVIWFSKQCKNWSTNHITSYALGAWGLMPIWSSSFNWLQSPKLNTSIQFGTWGLMAICSKKFWCGDINYL